MQFGLFFIFGMVTTAPFRHAFAAVVQLTTANPPSLSDLFLFPLPPFPNSHLGFLPMLHC